MEPQCARWAEGSLAKAMVYGDAKEFECAMEQFIETMGFHPPGVHQDKDLNLSSGASTCSTASTSSLDHSSSDGNKLVLGPSRAEQKKGTGSVLADLWRSADIDGNGQLSETEARETLRVFLSRPQLRTKFGEPLKTVITARMANHVNFREVLDLHDELSDCLSYMVHERVFRLCKHAVSKSCLDVAKNLHDVTDAFWAAMDLNNNGQVDEHEFIRSFEDAINKVVIEQLWNCAEKRAWKMVEVGCWKCTTTEQMDGMMQGHKEKEKKKKQESMFAATVSKLPSAKDEAGEFCQGADCVVM
jgi:hypothetical protein